MVGEEGLKKRARGTPCSLWLSCPDALSLLYKRSGTKFALRLRLALTKGRRL